LGFVFREQKQYEKSAIYADSSRMEALVINNQYGVLEAYDLLISIHEDQHHYKEALKYSLLHSALKDSLTKAENRTVVAELEIKYQYETKAAEIEILKADKGAKEAMISRQKAIQIATVVVLFLVVIVALVLINRYRIVNHARRMVEIERVRNGIARDLHDDVGSTLSSINILSKVALAEKNGSIDHYLQRIGDQSSRMMEDISDIVWSINPNNDTIGNVTIRMREFATEILEPKNIRYRFNENISEGLTLDADKRKNLFLIFKESVNNAAKYSQANQIDVYLHQRDNSLVMNVKDNGIGFDESLVKTGNGLKNLRERAREINGAVTVKSWELKGTEIELILPLT
jgi:signal transduction histidine kinase